MSYKANIAGFEGQEIEVKVSFWTGSKLLVNGKPAQRGQKRGEMLLQRNDGRQVSATWKQQALGLDVPQLVVDGNLIKLVEPLKWYEWLWSGLPILLAFMGGALGAIAGMIAVYFNSKVFRSGLNGWLKYAASGMVSILAVIVYFIAAVFVNILIRG
jgi:hypothetical protein